MALRTAGPSELDAECAEVESLIALGVAERDAQQAIDGRMILPWNVRATSCLLRASDIFVCFAVRDYSDTATLVRFRPSLTTAFLSSFSTFY